MKLFVLLSRVPYPLEKGDKLRAFNQIKELSNNHEIYLCAFNDTKLHPEAKQILSAYCKEIHIFPISKWSIFLNVLRFFFMGKPLQCGYFYNRNIHKKIRKLINSIQPDHVYSQLIRTSEYVKDSTIKKTLDYQDAFSKGFFRMMKTSPFWIRWFLLLEHKRLVAYEKKIFSYFDYKTIITEIDRSYIQHPEADKITVVPNGVDFSIFKSIQVEKKYDLLFTGNFSYPPNIDAAVYLVNEIFPIVREKYPTINIVLCGANPAEKVLDLQQENVLVTGWVDDISEYYALSRVFIAPMRLGTGLQNKLLEAMAMQLPCITSALASNPLHAENKKEIMVCNNTSEFAHAIDVLLSQPTLYQEISSNGYKFVNEHYTWESTTAILEKLISQNQSNE